MQCFINPVDKLLSNGAILLQGTHLAKFLQSHALDYRWIYIEIFPHVLSARLWLMQWIIKLSAY